MATRVQYTVVDDIDGSTDGVGTYRFTLEGVEYEIDLSLNNLGNLRGCTRAVHRRRPAAAQEHHPQNAAHPPAADRRH